MSVPKNALAEWRGYWFLPLVAALGYATAVLHIYSLGPFFVPITQEFGWTRAEFQFGLTTTTMISGIFCIPVGILVDRVGPRRLALIGVPLLSAGVALLSLATGELGNWIFLWGVIAIGTFFAQATVWTSAVATRFKSGRGMAFGVTLAGASLAQIVFPLMATELIAAFGWRNAFAAMGGLWAALVFPMLLLLFHGARDKTRKPAAPTPEAARAMTGLSIAEALRSRALYILLLAGGLFSFTILGAVIHFVPMLTDSGATPRAAAGMAAIIGVFSIIGRLGTGFLLDHFKAHLVGAVAFLIPVAACALLLLDGANPISQSAAAAIIGLTLGSEVDVIAYLAARHFGLRNFGALYGALITALAIGTSLGPLVAAHVFDKYASYDPFLMLMMALTTISAVALVSLGSPKALQG